MEVATTTKTGLLYYHISIHQILVAYKHKNVTNFK